MKNSLPTIGISGQWNVTQELITMRPSYIAALENAGAIPMIIPVTENRRTLDFYIENCDALLLSGGQDIQPHLYGEELQPHCGELVPVRDRVESYIFERAMALDKVLFGICRGFQMVNVACGGTLYQRDDDRAETVAVRLTEYHKKTAPLIDFYARKGKLLTVNGDAPVDAVAEEIARELGA